NTWSWGRSGEGYWPKPSIRRENGRLVAEHATLGRFVLMAAAAQGTEPAMLLTENETNTQRLYGAPGPAHGKDAFHEAVVGGRREAVMDEGPGTKAACHYHLTIPAGEEVELRLRLVAEAEATPETAALKGEFDRVFFDRRGEADRFFASIV